MTHNIEMLETVAEGLDYLLAEVVFLGGATVALYATDPAAPQARPTDDVDLVFEITSRLEYSRLEEKLRTLRFTHDTSAGAPICRWIFRGVRVDAMPTDPQILGFANQWYRDALMHSTSFFLPSGRRIKIFSPPYFLATKLEAFRARGINDIRLSPDFEDVTFLLDNRPELPDELDSSDPIAKQFIQTALRDLLQDPLLREAIEAALGFGVAGARVQRMLSIMARLANPE